MPASPNDSPALIPRTILFGNPSRVAPLISPDGQQLAWLAPFEGVLNIWLAPVDDLAQQRPITKTKGRPIRSHAWNADGRYLLFANDANGDENFRVFATDIATGETRDLTPYDRVLAGVVDIPRDFPDRIVVAINDRDPAWHDLWWVDLATGRRTPIIENKQQLGSFVFDRQGNLRIVRRAAPEKLGYEFLLYKDGTLQPWRFVPFADAMSTWGIGFNADGTRFHMLSCIDRDKTALISIDMASNAETIIAERDDCDISGALVNIATYEIDALVAGVIKPEWTLLNKDLAPTFTLMEQHAPGKMPSLVSASRDNRTWIVALSDAEQPALYCLIDRDKLTLRELFHARPELVPFRLAPMEGTIIKSRDGLNLVSYLTLPPGEKSRPEKPLPMVLLVHGGPWARDSYGYIRMHQWLANRGYATLSVNYRGSTGFGKAFINAGDKEHAGKMHDDLIDAVQWAIAEGIAQQNQVAIMGASYGGYASFLGATFTPDVFCCAVPIVGITDLVTLMQNVPPYWASFRDDFFRRYADPNTEEGRAWLRARSPLYKVDAIKIPLLIGHGANDVRCTLAQSDLIVDVMQKKGLDVTYVVYPDEGHGFARPENELAFNAMIEAFLAQQLGGRCEPVGKDFSGSSHEIRAGGTFITSRETNDVTQ